MKKVLFFGDSITDAVRNREAKDLNDRFGYGFVIQVAATLLKEDPLGYDVVNRGVSGDRIVDLYARVKRDVWNERPDHLTILVGINDISHEVVLQNGVDINRYENIFRLMLSETKQRLPDTAITLMEPFVLKGEISNIDFEKYDKIRDYALVVKKLAKEFSADFIPLQDKFDALEAKYGENVFLRDGVHPTVAGAAVIAEEWLKRYKR